MWLLRIFFPFDLFISCIFGILSDEIIDSFGGNSGKEDVSKISEIYLLLLFMIAQGIMFLSLAILIDHIMYTCYKRKDRNGSIKIEERIQLEEHKDVLEL